VAELIAIKWNHATGARLFRLQKISLFKMKIKCNFFKKIKCNGHKKMILKKLQKVK